MTTDINQLLINIAVIGDIMTVVINMVSMTNTIIILSLICIMNFTHMITLTIVGITRIILATILTIIPLW